MGTACKGFIHNSTMPPNNTPAIIPSKNEDPKQEAKLNILSLVLFFLSRLFHHSI